MSVLAQYACTRDPLIVATVDRNQRQMRLMTQRATEWANERGYDAARTQFEQGRFTVLGLPNPPRLAGFGAWTVPKPYVRISRPNRTRNKAEADRMAELSGTLEELPGVPVVSYRNGNGETVIVSARAFVLDDVAYAGFTRVPGEMPRWGSQWAEVDESEFLRASTRERTARRPADVTT